MKIKAVLTDLDGTLLPAEQPSFIKEYFRRLTLKMTPLGYEPDALIAGLWAGIHAMKADRTDHTNREVFLQSFRTSFGEAHLADIPVFEDFYRNEFDEVRCSCGFTPFAAELVQRIKSQKLPLILATNPVFPADGLHCRIRWAGLVPEDFDWITSYENSTRCKPDTAYYEEILQHFQLDPQDCLMIGNDMDEDMTPAVLGMKTFLLTDCLINHNAKDISIYPNGTYFDLFNYLDNLF